MSPNLGAPLQKSWFSALLETFVPFLAKWGPPWPVALVGIGGNSLDFIRFSLEIDGFSSIFEENPRISLNIRARPASAELGRPAGRWLGQPAESQPEAGAQKSRFPVLPSPPDPWAPWMSFLVHTFQRRSNRTTSFILEGSGGIVKILLLNILH